MYVLKGLCVCFERVYVYVLKGLCVCFERAMCMF